MFAYGITDKGFNRKRLDQLLKELNSELKSIFGENFNVSPESPDGQINGVVSESNANLWEIAEIAYNCFSPSDAIGNALSNLVQLNGITRLDSSPSIVNLNMTGKDGTQIPAGSLVSTIDTGAQFKTDNNVTIESGAATVVAKATVKGPIIAKAGTVTKIDNPVSGWHSVDNPRDAEIGRYEETDVELRARRERSVARDAQAIVDAIYAGIANVAGVVNVVVLENDQNVTDKNGLPPHSFQVIATGGSDQDIANMIWLKKPAGILSFGDTTTEINDSQGLSHKISFSRPTTKDVYVRIEIKPFDNYPKNGDELIKNAVVDYANGELLENRGFGVSDDVILTRLYTPTNSVNGHEIVSIQIGLSVDSLGENNIAISPTEIASFAADRIEVVLS